MTEENNTKNDTVGLFLRAMVDREPGKRKVKPSKAALIDLAELDLGESSDDSDFNVDEAKLKEDDDISINSDPEDDDDLEEDSDENSVNDDGSKEEITSKSTAASVTKENLNLTVEELLLQAQEKHAESLKQGIIRPKILVCAICLGDYSDDANEIVTCDGCHVSVHEGCYGISDTISVSSTVSSSSTEPWFCDACKAGVTNPPCELCPNLSYTIFKETEMGRWVHLVCALYVPGIAFSEVDKLSFPTMFEMPYSRWGTKSCSLCEDERYSKTGICIGCDAGMCRSYFHVTCAQREGLLSEVNHCEADQADPYYAHCKLHTDRELIRRRKRNWLALQMHMKQGEIERLAESQKTQDRLHRKLIKYREKYFFTKANRPTPWFPTQKMPRSIATNASFFRTMLHKTKLMGFETESHVPAQQSLGEIRKKWHVPPAFNIEFFSYYLDRTPRFQEMKSRLNLLLEENNNLLKEETELRAKYNLLEKENKKIKTDNANLLNKALEIHDSLKGLAGRPLRLPPAIAALHNPTFVESDPLPLVGELNLGSGCKEKRVITKAAAKMISYSVPSSPVDNAKNSPSKPSSLKSSHFSTILNDIDGPVVSLEVLSIHHCSVCQLTKDQHLLIQCDTCHHYYHLSCLDPPLTRMPKKTKQMGWQCSDCCKSSDSDKTPEIDTAAPRRLRRIIKEPAKFSPSVVKDKKDNETPPKGSANVKTDLGSSPVRNHSNISPSHKIEKEMKSPKSGVKRLQSSDTKRGKKKIKRSLDAANKSSSTFESGSLMVTNATNITLDMSAESLPSASSLNSPHSESFPSADDDPTSPRKEKKHREGGKKKKKDRNKDKELEGGRKKKKHHHKDRHNLGEMASEFVSPFRIKIKPLPPRPNEIETIAALPMPIQNLDCEISAPHTTSTTTAPPGYPPLPPGYTLTQPVMVTSASSSSEVNTAIDQATSRNASNLISSSTNVPAVAAVASTTNAQRQNVGRRKSDLGTEQFSKCDVCGETGGVTNTVMCDECLKAYHFNCLEPPLKKSPKKRGYSWFCEDCGNSGTNSSDKLT